MDINVLLNQMGMMGLLILLGYVFGRTGKLTLKGAQEITNILFQICTPMIMINALNMPFSIETLNRYFISFIVSLILILISVGISMIFFKSNERIERFACSFSNVGFMGIPLVEQYLGIEYVFYVTACIIALNIVSWTLGIIMITGRKESVMLRQIIRNPAFTGLAVGLLFFALPIEFPAFITTTVQQVAQINTVLAMIVLGYYVSTTSVSKIINLKALRVSTVRLIFIPLVLMVILGLGGSRLYDMREALLIVVAAPAGVNTALFAEQAGQDYAYATGIVSLSTILSVVTIPLMILISTVVWSML
ncbi:hypothetical protein AOC36_00430 [Erysipelothrix larvae]|uniref:AEC family transporter n=1 Tax=Erysipelothrix larvae TaxID=1514105 RepID=A0A0X8GY11_9FIRM|nr:AEC family transporter [Erysipelothrix larvae]AMC92513.1 hypothetical protein AOC36_00430 [Erysipelothrix larvae]